MTKIELLGWRGHTEEGFSEAKEFLSHANTIPLDEDLIDLVVDMGRNCNIKLPDAVIAATAFLWDLTLIPRNEEDFIKLSKLKMYNLFK